MGNSWKKHLFSYILESGKLRTNSCYLCYHMKKWTFLYKGIMSLTEQAVMTYRLWWSHLLKLDAIIALKYQDEFWRRHSNCSAAHFFRFNDRCFLKLLKNIFAYVPWWALCRGLSLNVRNCFLLKGKTEWILDEILSNLRTLQRQAGRGGGSEIHTL